MHDPVEGHRIKCPECELFFVICSRCYRGHIYYSPKCSSTQRKRSKASSKSRYESSFKGRKSHALRQKRYRERNREKQEVTHDPSVLKTQPVQRSGGNLFNPEIGVIPKKLSCIKCGIRLESILLPQLRSQRRGEEFWNTIRSWSQE